MKKEVKFFLLLLLVSLSMIGMERKMVLVKAGSFMMGNTLGDIEGHESEKPIHLVNITYDYYISKHELTFDEYDTYCDLENKAKPFDRGAGRGRRPVINVSWFEAISYCNWLSQKEKIPPAYDKNGNLLDEKGEITTDMIKVKGYRLPTEAEWEYVARGGHMRTEDYKYSGSNNIDEVAWHDANTFRKTQEVGLLKPNDLGVYDMSGNVFEWCNDWWDTKYYSQSPSINPTGPNAGSYKVMRGGGWYRDAKSRRVSFRGSGAPTDKSGYLGFRIVKTY